HRVLDLRLRLLRPPPGGRAAHHPLAGGQARVLAMVVVPSMPGLAMPPAAAGRQARSAVRASAMLLLLGFGSACALDLPISERIANVRPLAMRVEVLDPLAPPDAAVRAEALPIETI